jgi:glutamyl-Q tRNA(Asp) synthetase
MHLPVAVNAAGEKLSKQTRAGAINIRCPVPYLVRALSFLGQVPPAELASCNLSSFWNWALKNWKPEKIPRLRFRSAETFA